MPCELTQYVSNTADDQPGLVDHKHLFDVKRMLCELTQCVSYTADDWPDVADNEQLVDLRSVPSDLR